MKLYDVYRHYKKVREVSILSDFIRQDGLSEVKWPKGLRSELADLLDAAYPWSGERELQLMIAGFFTFIEVKPNTKLEKLEKT